MKASTPWGASVKDVILIEQLQQMNRTLKAKIRKLEIFCKQTPNQDTDEPKRYLVDWIAELLITATGKEPGRSVYNNSETTKIARIIKILKIEMKRDAITAIAREILADRKLLFPK